MNDNGMVSFLALTGGNGFVQLDEQQRMHPSISEPSQQCLGVCGVLAKPVKGEIFQLRGRT